MKSNVVYAASLCTFGKFQTMIWPSIKTGLTYAYRTLKSLQKFSHRNQKENVPKNI